MYLNNTIVRILEAVMSSGFVVKLCTVLLLLLNFQKTYFRVCVEAHTHITTHTHTHKLVNTGKRGPPIVPLLFIL